PAPASGRVRSKNGLPVPMSSSRPCGALTACRAAHGARTSLVRDARRKRNTWAHQERSSGSGLFRIIAESYQVGTVKLLPANGEHFWAGDTTFAGAISWEIAP